MKQIRKRLTYANVMSSIAVFLVVGGATAFAALGKNTVGTKQLKKNAVNTAKLKKNAVSTNKIRNNAINGGKVVDGSLTGADLKLDSIGTVPSAKNAETANVAQFAGQLTGRKIFFRVPPGTAETEVLNVGGLVLRASCSAGGALSVEAESTIPQAFLQADSTDDTGTETGNTSADPGDVEAFVVTPVEFEQGFVWYAAPNGSVVSVQWQADEDQPAAVNNCVFAGTAQQG